MQSGISGSFAIPWKRQRTIPPVPTTTPMELDPAAAASTAISPAAVAWTDVMCPYMDESADEDDDSIYYVSDDDSIYYV
jgi:hypothetical protein